jgi:hypothetical protein
MKVKGSTVFLILVVAFTFLFLSAQWVNLSNRDSGIDRLEKVYSSLKEKLDPSFKIYFDDNLPEGSEKTELYFQSQFVLAPNVLTKDNINHRVVLIEKEGLPSEDLGDCDTLWKETSDDLHFYYLFKY